MKRLIVVVAAIVAGCSAQKPTVEAPAPNVITLGTFTGEVDTVKGTFTVQMDPATPPLGGPQYQVIPEGAGTVSIANSSSPWNEVRAGQCGGVLPVTGANVIVTQTALSPTFYGAVYAEITAVSPSYVSACNSAVAPSGYDVSAQYGLWSHGSLAWVAQGGATTSATTEWNFLTGTQAKFTFSGRIVALRGTDLTGFGTASTAYGTLQDTGTHMVYAPNTTSLRFIKYDGTSDGTSTAVLPAGYATSLAVDANRIWFGTSSNPAYVGYMSPNGATVSSVAAAGATLSTVSRIRIDPTTPNQAFYVQQGTSGEKYLGRWLDGDPSSTIVATLPNTPDDFVWGGAPGFNAFIASMNGNAVYEYTKAGALVNTFSLASTSCQSPTGITRTSDGTFWVSGSSNICTLVPTGTNAATITVKGACAFPYGIVTDGNDNVWAACMTLRKLVRFTQGSSAILTVGIPQATNVKNVGISSGLVWSTAGSHVYRMAY